MHQKRIENHRQPVEDKWKDCVTCPDETGLTGADFRCFEIGGVLPLSQYHPHPYTFMVATISISSSSLHYHGYHYLFIMVAIITISIITINHPCHEEMF